MSPFALPDDSRLPAGSPLHGVPLPASKSVTNRTLLLAALTPGVSILRGGLEAEDTRWMRQALRTCGTLIEETGDCWAVHGGAPPLPASPLHLGASGTTLRFLLPWLAIFGGGPITLLGDLRLFERPIEPLEAVLRSLGARIHRTSAGMEIFPLTARPASLDLEINASLSSQFLSGLALAAAALPGISRLRWSAVTSASYLRLTAQWLRAFGCKSEFGGTAWHIQGGSLSPVDLRLPVDWSAAAAFYAAAAATGRAITLGPWAEEDAQGDRQILQILKSAGCHVQEDGSWITLRGPMTSGIRANLSLCPDLGPVLAAAAALAPGPSELTGLHTLRLKECDRLEASAELVAWLGGRADVLGDHTLRLWPGPPQGARPPFDPRNDHRMAFAAAVGALRRPGEILDPTCVSKTFPDFWIRWQQMLGI